MKSPSLHPFTMKRMSNPESVAESGSDEVTSGSIPMNLNALTRLYSTPTLWFNSGSVKKRPPSLSQTSTLGGQFIEIIIKIICHILYLLFSINIQNLFQWQPEN